MRGWAAPPRPASGALRTPLCAPAVAALLDDAQRRAVRVPCHSLPWQLPGRAAGAVQLATPYRVAWIGRAESAAGVGAAEGAAVGWPVRWPIGGAEV